MQLSGGFLDNDIVYSWNMVVAVWLLYKDIILDCLQEKISQNQYEILFFHVMLYFACRGRCLVWSTGRTGWKRWWRGYQLYASQESVLETYVTHIILAISYEPYYNLWPIKYGKFFFYSLDLWSFEVIFDIKEESIQIFSKCIHKKSHRLWS